MSSSTVHMNASLGGVITAHMLQQVEWCPKGDTWIGKGAGCRTKLEQRWLDALECAFSTASVVQLAARCVAESTCFRSMDGSWTACRQDFDFCSPALACRMNSLHKLASALWWQEVPSPCGTCSADTTYWMNSSSSLFDDWLTGVGCFFSPDTAHDAMAPVPTRVARASCNDR